MFIYVFYIVTIHQCNLEDCVEISDSVFIYSTGLWKDRAQENISSSIKSWQFYCKILSSFLSNCNIVDTCMYCTKVGQGPKMHYQRLCLDHVEFPILINVEQKKIGVRNFFAEKLSEISCFDDTLMRCQIVSNTKQQMDNGFKSDCFVFSLM